GDGGRRIHGDGGDAGAAKRDLDRPGTRRAKGRDRGGRIHVCCSGDDDGEFRSGNHGGFINGEFANGGRGGLEHRSGGSHRKPGRDTDNGWRSGDGGQRIHGDGGDAGAEMGRASCRGRGGAKERGGGGPNKG